MSFLWTWDTHLLHSVHCHRQTVRKATCSWGHMPEHGPALRCCGPSAGCSRNLSSEEPKKQSRRDVCIPDMFLIPLPPANLFGTHLELLQLLQDHVVRHVVEEPIGGGEDDVPNLDIEGGAVCSVRAEGNHTIESGRDHMQCYKFSNSVKMKLFSQEICPVGLGRVTWAPDPASLILKECSLITAGCSTPQENVPTPTGWTPTCCRYSTLATET